jgi:PEGA domain-containing protein
MVHHFLVLILVLLVEGCYTSVVKVDSNPPGATVHYDFQPKGITPVEFKVDYLGTHKLTLDHPDYGRREAFIDLDSPAYLVFPFDFVTTVIPANVTDRHSFTFDLTKEPSSDLEAHQDDPKDAEKK